MGTVGLRNRQEEAFVEAEEAPVQCSRDGIHDAGRGEERRTALKFDQKGYQLVLLLAGRRDASGGVLEP